MGAEGAIGPDLLAGAAWACVSSPAGTRSGPGDLEGSDLYWLAATVPGTVAEALRLVGASEPSLNRLDGQDWWFRCRFPGPESDAGSDNWILSFEGLATLADVWLNGRHLLRSESMHARWSVPVQAVEEVNELCLRFAALTPVLEQRRPRPRWKVKGVRHQNLRWIRTTLLGRRSGWAVVPVPVGPWRPLHLRKAAPIEIATRRVRATCVAGPRDTTTGTVSVELEVHGSGLSAEASPVDAELEVAGVRVPMQDVGDGPGRRLFGTIVVEDVQRWWPHTHGDQPLYGVRAVIAGQHVDLGEVGFRTIEVDRSDGGFTLVVNGVPVFCRGAAWYPPEPVSLQTTDEDLAATIDLARRSGMNMLRIPGDTLYEEERFFDACDRAGLLVWQEVMLGPVDPPDDEAFTAVVAAEVSTLLNDVARHPCLAVLCGGQEIEGRPAMFGLPRDRWRSPLIHEILPELVAREAPGLEYVSSSPSGGDLPFQADVGVSHYFGVGVYLFPLEDFRRAGPRFVSEGLAFSIPPERMAIAEDFGADLYAHHESDWKRAVHRDAGSWFDLEDVRDHYVNSLFGVEVGGLWRTDHLRALDLGRAAMAEVVTAAAGEWRRADSPCEGMLSIAFRDLRAGPGWGLVDSAGRAKAPLFALARSWAPIAVLATDEGVNGLSFHVVNDTAEVVEARLEIGLHTAAHNVETASVPVVIDARGGTTIRAEAHFDGFRDLTYAYCFGPRGYELVTADLIDESDQVLARCAFLPGGPSRADDPDVGLQAEVEPADGGVWILRVSSLRFAQYVQIDVPGFVAGDSWFHLPPGGSRLVALRPEAGSDREPRGRVRSLNSKAEAAVSP